VGERRIVRISSADPLSIRDAVPRELRATAQLHHRELSGLFVDLGPRFLRSYHAAFAGSPDAVALVATNGIAPLGFLCGTLNNERHYRLVVRRHVPALFGRAVSSLLARPRLAVFVLRTRTRRYARALALRLRGDERRDAGTVRDATPSASRPERSGHPVAAARRRGPIAVLTHVAVAPEARGGGAGRQLVAAFVARARAAGASEIRLVTDPATPAPEFYRHLGWTSLGVRPGRDGVRVEEFRLRL
jgi:ribosomal protein S18 acetylase RimI-like enzyme